MRLSDEKVIEFLWKSPVRSFGAMLDTLRYLDGQSISADVEYELMDEPLGDNSEGTRKIRVPKIGGITANALLKFGGHAQEFNLVRRRIRTFESANQHPYIEAEPEIRVFYDLTPSGSYMLKVLEVLTDISTLAEQGASA